MTRGTAAQSTFAAISAHRGGGEVAPAGTYEAFAAAAGSGAEYVEFDVRQTADGELAVFHDARVGGAPVADLSHARLCELAGYRVPLAADVMRLIGGRALGHVDVKETGGEARLVEQALDVLGPGNFVATTLEDTSAAAIKERFPEVPVALSLGRDLNGLPWRKWPGARRRELYPLARILACGADWVAMHRQLALAGVLRRCHRRGIKTMVWTVNSDPMIARWLADPRVDVLVTDRPARAVALRERLRAAEAGESRPRRAR